MNTDFRVLIETIGKREVPKHKKFVEIEVAGNTLDLTDVIMPSVRYQMYWNLYHCNYIYNYYVFESKRVDRKIILIWMIFEKIIINLIMENKKISLGVRNPNLYPDPDRIRHADLYKYRSLNEIKL